MNPQNHCTRGIDAIAAVGRTLLDSMPKRLTAAVLADRLDGNGKRRAKSPQLKSLAETLRSLNEQDRAVVDLALSGAKSMARRKKAEPEPQGLHVDPAIIGKPLTVDPKCVAPARTE